MAAMAFVVSLLLLIALGTPPEYRMWVLGGVSMLLLAIAAYCSMHARQQLTRDAALIGDFTKGLRLDLAMVNLALKEPETADAEPLAAREPAETEVPAAAPTPMPPIHERPPHGTT
jgi:hypothetical protein